MTLPFYLFVMTALATILTLYTMKRSEKLKFIIIGLIVCVFIYYFKDLSLTLGKTDRIPLILSIWTPVIALSFSQLLELYKLMKSKFFIILLTFFCCNNLIGRIYLS